MSDDSKNRGQASRPLWLMAISLATIAMCLVVLVFQSQPPKVVQKQVAATPSVEKRSDPPNRFYSKRSSGRTNLSSKAKTATLSDSPSNDDRVTIITSESAAASLVTEGASGIIAPVAVLANTNFSTAIVGHVSLRGQPPPESPINMRGDTACSRSQTNTPTTRHFVVNDEGGLADVLVSIVGGLGKVRHLPPPTKRQVIFANCRIQPYVSAAQTGQQLVFTNADSVAHKVRFTPTNSPALNRALVPAMSIPSFKLVTPELFARVRCDLHPWEFAYVSVVEHPFFAVTDTDGDFVIPNVPPGKYQVRALHRKVQSTNDITREVTVNPGEISFLNFALDAPER